MSTTLLAPAPDAKLFARAHDALDRHARAHGGKGTAVDYDATNLRLAVLTRNENAIHDTLHNVRIGLGDFCCYCRKDIEDDGGEGEDDRYCSSNCGHADNIDPLDAEDRARGW